MINSIFGDQKQNQTDQKQDQLSTPPKRTQIKRPIDLIFLLRTPSQRSIRLIFLCSLFARTSVRPGPRPGAWARAGPGPGQAHGPGTRRAHGPGPGRAHGPGPGRAWAGPGPDPWDGPWPGLRWAHGPGPAWGLGPGPWPGAWAPRPGSRGPEAWRSPITPPRLFPTLRIYCEGCVHMNEIMCTDICVFLCIFC